MRRILACVRELCCQMGLISAPIPGTPTFVPRHRVIRVFPEDLVGTHPSTLFFTGYAGLSKCVVVRLGTLVALTTCYLERSRTSVTNMYEELATEVWDRYYRHLNPRDLVWYDYRPLRHSLTGEEQFLRVRMAWNPQEGRYENAAWDPANQPPPPEQLVREMHRIMAEAVVYASRVPGVSAMP